MKPMQLITRNLSNHFKFAPIQISIILLVLQYNNQDINDGQELSKILRLTVHGLLHLW